MHDFIRDPDVLDTWFSSALWPFSTLGWPDQTRDLQVFYPTSTLVTGLDILFFWVARMIMMGLKFMGDVPFRAVYIHALVRDAEGQKMSKSKGNVIDPLGVMDTYGTDALRFTLASMASPGRDIKLAQERIEGYRNFANKIWNATRFVLMHLEGPIQHVEVERRGLADRWILSRMNGTIDRVTRSLEEFRFDHAAAALYQFIWHEYCDWYLEMVKPALQQETNEAPAVRRTLIESLETIQRLLHPVMPFITEEIWQILPVSPRPASSIMRAPYPMPKPEWHAPDVEADFVILERFVTTARNARALLDYQPAASVILYGDADNEADRARLARVRPFIDSLARGRIELSPISQWSTGRVLRLTIERLTVGMAVESDVDVGKALARVAKQRQDVAAERKRVEGKLNNAEFVRNAPPDVVAEYRERLSTAEHEERMLASSTDQLQRMTA
jgi:valyl-tRNA synthetase